VAAYNGLIYLLDPFTARGNRLGGIGDGARALVAFVRQLCDLTFGALEGVLRRAEFSAGQLSLPDQGITS
jgi:hypothetical protein